MNEKNIQIKKGEQNFKSYSGTYNVKLLSPFNPELQREDTESAIKSRLIKLLAQLLVLNS